jgi:hypothetical protein
VTAGSGRPIAAPTPAVGHLGRGMVHPGGADRRCTPNQPRRHHSRARSKGSHMPGRSLARGRLRWSSSRGWPPSRHHPPPAAVAGRANLDDACSRGLSTIHRWIPDPGLALHAPSRCPVTVVSVYDCGWASPPIRLYGGQTVESAHPGLHRDRMGDRWLLHPVVGGSHASSPPAVVHGIRAVSLSPRVPAGTGLLLRHPSHEWSGRVNDWGVGWVRRGALLYTDPRRARRHPLVSPRLMDGRAPGPSSAHGPTDDSGPTGIGCPVAPPTVLDRPWWPSTDHAAPPRLSGPWPP